MGWVRFGGGLLVWCAVPRVRCPGPPGSCSPACMPCVWCCVCDVLGRLAPVHQCARSVCGVACTVSWASWLLFTGVHALCVVLRVRCSGPPGSCSPVCTLCAWCCVYGVLGLLAPVHRCARSVCGVACTASWASWLLFTGVHALCVVLRVRCPGPPGSCSPVCTLCVWCCLYGVLGLLAPVHGVHALCVGCPVGSPGPPGSCSPVCTLCAWCCVYGVLGFLALVHRCARSVFGVACTASWASWLLFTGVHAPCVVLRVRRPGPPGSCSPLCTLCVWCCVYGVLGLLAPVHRCARSLYGVACTASWASWLLFTAVHALCVVLCVRCSGPPGSCSPVCTLCVRCCVYGVLGLLAPVHRCARSVRGVAFTVSWASWLLFTGVHALCVVLRVRRPGPPGSCSPVCTLCVWCCVYGVLGLLAPVHGCARSVCGVAYTASWASSLLFTGVRALCVVLCVRCPGPPGSCSPVCTLCVWCCVYGVLGFLAPVRRCARSVCGVACTASWAFWLLFTGVHALCVVLRVRCPGPPGSCSLVCTLCVWCCVYGVLGLWLLFTGVHALCVVLCVRCPGPPGSCSPLYTLCVWCCVYGVLGPLAPVHRCARSVCGVVCTASWASWLLFTGVHALCVVLRVRCPGPPGTCSPVCMLCVWCCVYGVLGLLAPVHRRARSVCGVACTVSWASRLLFTGGHALCVVLCAWCPGPLGSCSPVRLLRCVVSCVRRPGPLGPGSAVCTLCVRCCVCGVLGLLAPVLWCACSLCRVVCVVFWASWLLSSGVSALCAVSCVWSPGPPGPFVLVCSRGVCCVVCVVSWDTLFVFSGVAVCCGVRGVRCAVLRVRCPGPPGPCSPVRTPGLWCCVGGVLGRLAPLACSVGCVLCAVSWATWLLFTAVRARCVAWCVRCGCGRVLACAIPLPRRCGLFVFVHTWLDTVGNAAANSPLASWPTRRPASYGVLLILPVLDSLVLATPKSKRVLMHAWRCMLFTRWFVDSLHFATPKSRRVCLMHS